jgi:hypothetical protein
VRSVEWERQEAALYSRLAGWTRTNWCELYLEWTKVVCGARLTGTRYIGRPEQQWKDQLDPGFGTGKMA